MGLRRRGWLPILLPAVLCGCSFDGGRAVAAPRPPGAELALTITSTAFEDGGEVPRAHTCDGADRSVPLRFAGAPERTSSFALVVDDPDAQRGTWVHWVLWNVPASAEGLPEAVPAEGDRPDGSRQGRNDFGGIGWRGPCPPRGQSHRFFFRLHALDAQLELRPGGTRAELDSAMQGHVVGRALLTGRYRRR